MTTYSDVFERADAETIGNGWTEFTNGWKLRSGAAVPDSTSTAVARAGTTMDTGDHYAEMRVGNTYGGDFVGPACRMPTLGTDAGTSGTWYQMFVSSSATTITVRRKEDATGNTIVVGSGKVATAVGPNEVLRLRVYRDPDVAGRDRLEAYVNGALIASGNDDSGLVPVTQRGVGMWAAGGTSTSLRVGSFHAADQSAPAPTGTDTTAPAVPTGLTLTTPDYGTVAASWNKPPDADYARSLLYRSLVSPVTAADTLVASPVGTTHTDSGLTGGTTYWYAVAAQDTTGNTSALSPSVSVTATAAPPPPDPGAAGQTGFVLLVNGVLVPQEVPGVTGAGAATHPQPVALQYGFKGFTADPALVAGNVTAMESGRVYYSRALVKPGDVLANWDAYISAIGSSVTLFRGAIWALDGALLASTPDMVTGLAAGAWKKQAFTAAYTVPAGVSAVFIGALAVGTTGPTLSRLGAAGSAAVQNASIVRAGTLAAQTDIPASVSTGTASNINLLMAVS